MSQCASKDAGPRGGWIGGPTSIGEGNECQRGRWAQRGWIVRSQLGEENEAFFIRV